MSRRLGLLACVLALAALTTPGWAQMVSGKDMPGYAETFGLTGVPTYKAQLLDCTAPGNVLWPGDTPTFTFQIQNDGDAPLTTAGRVEVIAYGTKGVPGDIWVPHVIKLAGGGSAPVAADVPAHGYQNVTVRPDVPARFGGYALVLDLGPAGRQFLTSCVRTFKATQGRVQYPKFCLDSLPPDVLKRLDVHAIRYGEGYKRRPTRTTLSGTPTRARSWPRTTPPTSPCCSWSAAGPSPIRRSRCSIPGPGWTTRA